MRVKRTPWQRIRNAADAGHGLRLSADEVWRLRGDDAIATKAVNDDLEQGLYVEHDSVMSPIREVKRKARKA